MHESFNVWTVHKDRHKMKDFIRFKPSQRQIYLFERGIMFCKIRMETSYQGLSPQYSFKKSIKVKGSSCIQKSAQLYGKKHHYPYFTDGLKLREVRLTCQILHNRARINTQACLTPEIGLVTSHQTRPGLTQRCLCDRQRKGTRRQPVWTNELEKYTPSSRQRNKSLGDQSTGWISTLTCLLNHTSLCMKAAS